ALQPAAMAAARRLRPHCRWERATSWGGGPLVARLGVSGTCAGEQSGLDLLCDRDPLGDGASCTLDAERERIAVEARALALADFVRTTGCPAATVRVVANTTAFENGRYHRKLRLTGCKDTARYSCRAGGRDEPPT